jgi:hypothetical protein
MAKKYKKSEQCDVFASITIIRGEKEISLRKLLGLKNDLPCYGEKLLEKVASGDTQMKLGDSVVIDFKINTSKHTQYASVELESELDDLF